MSLFLIRSPDLRDDPCHFRPQPSLSPAAKAAETFGSAGYLAWLEMAMDGYEADRNIVVVLDLATRKKWHVTKEWDRSPSAVQWAGESGLWLKAEVRHFVPAEVGLSSLIPSATIAGRRICSSILSAIRPGGCLSVFVSRAYSVHQGRFGFQGCGVGQRRKGALCRQASPHDQLFHFSQLSLRPLGPAWPRPRWAASEAKPSRFTVANQSTHRTYQSVGRRELLVSWSRREDGAWVSAATTGGDCIDSKERSAEALRKEMAARLLDPWWPA